MRKSDVRDFGRRLWKNVRFIICSPCNWNWKRVSEIGQFVAAVGSLIVAVVALRTSLQSNDASLAIAQLTRQADAAQKQLEITRDQQRPRVALLGVPSFSAAVSLNQNGVRFPLRLVVKNSGQRPAISTGVYAEPSFYPYFPGDRKKGVCQAAEKMGALMIPANDGFSEDIETSINMRDLRLATSQMGDATNFVPTIYLCIAYRDTATPELWHHSSYEIRIQTLRPLRPGRGCCALNGEDLPIPPDNLRVLFSPSSNTLPPD